MKPRMLVIAAMLATATLAAQAMPSAQAPALTGEVLEVKDVPSYTYLRLKTKDGEVWAAVSTAAVKKGAKVTLDNAMVMENFESKALGRKFDRIVFASLADPNTAPAAAAPAAAAPPGSHGAAAAPAVPVAKLARAAGPDAKTVAEVVAGTAALKDKTVAIHGQVVKANLGILGKNWIHLQDGSGSAASGNHDILVTTLDTPAVGEVVTATGTVRANVDLGSGYVYAVLVADAKVRK